MHMVIPDNKYLISLRRGLGKTHKNIGPLPGGTLGDKLKSILSSVVRSVESLSFKRNDVIQYRFMACILCLTLSLPYFSQKCRFLTVKSDFWLSRR